MKKVLTTLGPKQKDELGLILPHEHVFVDLGPIAAKSYEQARLSEVLDVMVPELEKARASSVTALVEATPVGVGRRVDIVKAVSEAANLPLIVATGIYREPWIPVWAQEASGEELYVWMLSELQDGIEATGVQAAWIKLSAGDEGQSKAETKILEAAVRAGLATNAVIGSHTRKGKVVETQLDILEHLAYPASRFIWIHTQTEPDFGWHLELAARGVWLEYDAIGSDGWDDNFFIRHIMKLVEAGYEKQILLSHDRGWYDPSKPLGGVQKPFSYLSTTFLPKLQAAGFDEASIQTLTHDNPFWAFAR